MSQIKDNPMPSQAEGRLDSSMEIFSPQLNSPQDPARGILLISPKITPPRPHKTLHRDRLINLLGSNQNKKLILILGQAAQGKTTLAASYLAQTQRPFIWINLGPDDSDPIILLSGLSQSLQAAFQEMNGSLSVDFQSLTIGPRAEIPMYRDLIRAFFSLVRSPLLIVLDGLDRLSPQGPSWTFLNILIDEAPDGVQILLLSREIPPLNIQRRQMSQEVLILTNDQIAFTMEEVKAFFKKVKNIPLSVELIRKIHQLTQGWVGGLLILSELIDFQPGKSLKKDEELSGLLEDLKGRMFPYFAEEVFSFQTDNIQDFLIKSSIFEVIDPQVVKDIFENSAAEESLTGLVEKNLFVFSFFVEGKGLMYRYHQLFRDFLQDKFKSTLTREEQQFFLIKAASSIEKAGDWEKALALFLQAQAFPEAGSLLKKFWTDLFNQGKIRVLARYLKAFPEDSIQEDPWLLFCLCLARRWIDIQKNVSRLKRCLAAFEEQEDLRGVTLALAYSLENLLITGGSRMEVQKYLEKGEKLLASSNPEEMAYEKATLWMQIGFIQTWWGNPRKGFSACQKAHWLAKDAGDLMLQGMALAHSTNALVWLGEYDLAEDLAQEMNALLKKIQVPELSCLHLLSLSLLYTCRCKLEEGRSATQKGLEEAEFHGLHHLYSVAVFRQFHYMIYSNRYAEAEQIGNHLMALAEATGISLLTARVTLFMAVIFFRQDLLPQAEEWFSRADTLCSAAETWAEYNLHFGKAFKALIRAKLSKPSDSNDDLQEALHYFSDIQAHQLLAESYFISALWHSTKGLTAKATEDLATGFKIYLEKRYDHFLILRPIDIGEVCALALEYEAPEAFECLTGLLIPRYGSDLKAGLKRLENHPRAKLREMTREIRRAIRRSQVPILHLKTLGLFQVLKPDTPVMDGDWQGKQSKKILKALLSYGGFKIPKDWLLETIWPQSSPSAAENSFKVTLHRLRKSLEPDLDEKIGSSYIHLMDNFLWLDADLCRVDVNEFLDLIQRAEEVEKKGGIKEALLLYQEAQNVYQGDFLSEDLYEPWVQPRQEAIKKKYIQIQFNQARIYEGRGLFRPAEACYKKIILGEPLCEEAYQKLMLLYVGHGMHTNARETYNECCRTLNSVLKVAPEEWTTSIYRRIPVS